MSIIDHLVRRLHSISIGVDASVFALRGLTKTSYVLRLSNDEVVFHLHYIIAQTTGQGCSYFDASIEQPEINEMFIGKDIREMHYDYNCILLAALDAAFSSFKDTPTKSHKINGNNINKAQKRARIIANESLELAKQCRPKFGRRVRILNIGVVGSIISCLTTNKDIDVIACDLYPGTIGMTVHGVSIQNGTNNVMGDRTLELLSEVDIAVVTGMTLANGTLDTILSTAKKHGTLLVLFAETGANFASEYRALGIDVVVSEPYPFYLIGAGPTQIDIYK